MAQTNDWQPELFGQFHQPPKPRWWARYWRLPQRFLVLRLAYEDLILGAIGALMVVVLGFCLGVERGKHLWVAEAIPVVVPMPARMAPPVVWPPPALAPAKPSGLVRPPAMAQPPSKTKLASAPAQGSGPYVVQVASFVDRTEASQAVARLAKRGVRGSLVTKGRYEVVYAGGFATYAQATEAAGRLRPIYRDCFIKKVVADPRG